MWWRRAGSDGAGAALSRRLARLELEMRRLKEAHRLFLAYMRGIDEDLAEVEDLLPVGKAVKGDARAGRRANEKEGEEALVFIECGECHRTVALSEEELGAFTDPIRCPYCSAELMKAWTPAATR